MRLNAHHTRLTALIGVLIVLASYAVTRWNNIHGGGSESAGAVFSSAPCPPAEPPGLSTVSRQELLRLRDDIGRVTSFSTRLRPYEQGLVGSSVAWSDAEPNAYTALSLDRRVSGGYEMRWWMPNGDDVVVDGFIFSSAKVAHTYFEQAAADDCRRDSSTRDAPFPDDARNLSWVNPDAYSQQDLFVHRGRRVYRVAVVKAGVDDSITTAARTEAFTLINVLARMLPGVGCGSRPGPSAVAA